MIPIPSTILSSGIKIQTNNTRHMVLCCAAHTEVQTNSVLSSQNIITISRDENNDVLFCTDNNLNGDKI